MTHTKIETKMNELVNVPYVQRKEGTATPTPTPTDPTPGNQGGNGDNGGGNDGMS